MFCTHSHNLLNAAASDYIRLGYRIGITKNKALVHDRHSRFCDPKSWDGISIILEGLVCVDMDCFTNLGVQLPPSLKERSPRGLHFLYRLPPDYGTGQTIVGWRKGVDLLTRNLHAKSPYNSDASFFSGHVLCSPSKGYSRLYPYAIPARNALPIAPNWLLDIIYK